MENKRTDIDKISQSYVSSSNSQDQCQDEEQNSKEGSCSNEQRDQNHTIEEQQEQEHDDEFPLHSDFLNGQSPDDDEQQILSEISKVVDDFESTTGSDNNQESSEVASDYFEPVYDQQDKSQVKRKTNKQKEDESKIINMSVDKQKDIDKHQSMIQSKKTIPTGLYKQEKWSRQDTIILQVIVALVGLTKCTYKELRELYFGLRFPKNTLQTHLQKYRRAIRKQYEKTNQGQLKDGMFDQRSKIADRLKGICDRWNDTNFKGFSVEEIEAFVNWFKNN